MAVEGQVEGEQQKLRRGEGEQKIELPSQAWKRSLILVILTQCLQGQLFQEEGRDLRESSEGPNKAEPAIQDLPPKKDQNAKKPITSQETLRDKEGRASSNSKDSLISHDFNTLSTLSTHIINALEKIEIHPHLIKHQSLRHQIQTSLPR